MTQEADTPLNLGLLRWRCRRGMLENDLLIERFFSCYGDNLSQPQALALLSLMELSDSDLLDLLMARKEPQGALDTPEVKAVLEQIRQAKVKK